MSMTIISNETISSPTPNNEELTQQAAELYDKWKRLGSFSRAIRCVAWIVVVMAAIASAIYFSVISSEVSEWYAILLATIFVTAISVVACGLIVLLLKPFFWYNRKKAKRIYERLIEAEETVLSSDILSVQTPTAEYMDAQPSIAQEDDSDFSIEAVFNNYQVSTCEVYNNTIYMRELQMDKAKWGEWCWVISACLVLIAVIAVAIAIAVLLVLLFISFLWILIDHYGGPSDYTYQDYDTDIPSKEPSLLRTFLSAFYGRFLKICEAVSKTKDATKNEIAQKSAMKLLLQAKGISLPNSIVLPYWPKLKA